MVVPNALMVQGTELTSREPDGARTDFGKAITKRGYRLVACRPSSTILLSNVTG